MDEATPVIGALNNVGLPETAPSRRTPPPARRSAEKRYTANAGSLLGKRVPLPVATRSMPCPPILLPLSPCRQRSILDMWGWS
jgi:hypothetical protein